MDLLKLVALDKDDIEVISTHLQDATLKVGDVVWRPAERRLVIGLNRFDWEAAAHNGHSEFRRRRTVLRFDRVLAVKCRSVSPKNPDTVLNLLAVEFAEADASGVVTLMFSGGAALRLDVECLEVELADLGPTWPTTCRPEHLEQRG